MSEYKRLGLAALLASAFRSAVPDAEQETRDEAQEAQIAELKTQFQSNADAARTAFDELIARVSGIEASDTSQQGNLDGVIAELKEMAETFTGPAGDPDDNGLVGEVAPVTTDTTSPTVDDVVQTAVDDGIDVPEPVVLPEPATGD